ITEIVCPLTAFEATFKVEPVTDPLRSISSIMWKHPGETRCMIPETVAPVWVRLAPPAMPPALGLTVETALTCQLPGVSISRGPLLPPDPHPQINTPRATVTNLSVKRMTVFPFFQAPYPSRLRGKVTKTGTARQATKNDNALRDIFRGSGARS